MGLINLVPSLYQVCTKLIIEKEEFHKILTSFEQPVNINELMKNFPLKEKSCRAINKVADILVEFMK
ncbi:MAG: hypothetical protein ABRQ39_00305 [Candidatus Eremiobacterota bacterium]